MSTSWTLISDLKGAGDHVAIKARLVRVFTVPTFNKKDVSTIECVFHDSQGDRIEASVPRNLTRAFKDELEEGQIYGLNNLKVVLDSRGYKLTACKFRVFFTDKTENLKLLGKKFPDKQFEFKSFEDVLAIQNADHVPAFDVIGLLVRVGQVERLEAKKGGEKRLLNILLRDTEMRTLVCTLWEDYVDKLLQLLEGHNSGQNIIILQLCKPSFYMNEKIVSNTFYATKLLLNAALPEVDEFKRRMPAASSTDVSLCNSMSQCTAPDCDGDYIHGVTMIKSIEDLLAEDEAPFCWISGTVDKIFLNEGWNYLACDRCKKKLSKVDTQFYCQKCNDYDSTPSLRYKLKIQVRDDTAFAKLLLWDKDCSAAIGKTAAELQENSTLVSSEDPHVLIQSALLDKSFYFKLKKKTEQSSAFGGVYIVNKIAADADGAPLHQESQESSSFPERPEVVNMNTPSSKATQLVDLQRTATEELPQLPTPGSVVSPDTNVKRSLKGAFSAVATAKKTRTVIKTEKK